MMSISFQTHFRNKIKPLRQEVIIGRRSELLAEVRQHVADKAFVT